MCDGDSVLWWDKCWNQMLHKYTYMLSKPFCMTILTGFPMTLAFFQVSQWSRLIKHHSKRFEYIISCIRMIWDCRKTAMFTLSAFNTAHKPKHTTNHRQQYRTHSDNERSTKTQYTFIHQNINRHIQYKRTLGVCLCVFVACTFSTLFHRLTQAHRLTWACRHTHTR